MSAFISQFWIHSDIMVAFDGGAESGDLSKSAGSARARGRNFELSG